MSNCFRFAVGDDWISGVGHEQTVAIDCFPYRCRQRANPGSKSLKVNPKQFEAVLALPGNRRFEHFVKVVVDRETAWGLYDDGWALAADNAGAPVFPLWPAEEYARACAIKEWSAYQPRSIELGFLTAELLPRMERDGVLPGVFFTPMSKGVTPSVAELLAALDAESSNY